MGGNLLPSVKGLVGILEQNPYFIYGYFLNF